MRHSPPGGTTLSAAGPGALYSYELQGDYLIGRLFGLFTVRRIHLAAVHYLRLATRSEVPPLHMLFNAMQFMPHRRSIRPVYILQTRSRHRIFLKLEGAAHFKLRQAIGRYSDPDKRMAA